jgi:hypothetical protein
MVDVLGMRATRVTAVMGWSVLREQACDANVSVVFTETLPKPKLARLWVFLFAVVPKVFVHRRELLAKRQREPVLEVVIRGNAVCNDIGFAKEEIAAEFVDHVVTS